MELALTFPADSFVLDGEALRLGADGRALAFQETASAFGTTPAVIPAGDQGRSVDGPDVRPPDGLRAYFFDVLHIDGSDLLDAPLRARVSRLHELVGVHAIPHLATDDIDLATRFATDALERGHEGVMVKDLASAYDAGRRGKSWRKVKPVRTFDLVVLGAEWGHGRRQGLLSNLHLGARRSAGPFEPVGLDGFGADEFVMVGKTFKGLTDAMLKWQTAALLDLASHREGITVFVRPELVVEIAIDGVQRSTRYPGGLALRFARVKGYRPDRSPKSADSIDSLATLLLANAPSATD